MLDFIKRWWAAIVAAALTFLAIRTAQKAEASKRKAQAAHDAAEVEKVAGHIGNAEKHIAVQKAEEEKSKALKTKARDYVDKGAAKEKSAEDLLSGWRTSNRVRRLRGDSDT